MEKNLKPIVDRVWRGHCWIKTDNGPRRLDVALDDARVELHLSGKGAFGVCPIAPGESITFLALLDLDSHKGETPWDDMWTVCNGIVTELRDRHLWPTVFRSSGGQGIHIFLLWNEPQDAYSVRQFLKDVLANCMLLPGTAGVAKNEVEVFPKQDSVPIDGYGSMFILPWAGKSEHLVGDWKASASIEKREKPERIHTTIETPTLKKLQSALTAIPNEDGKELSYDDWRNIVFAIHYATNGSDEGLQLAHDFSARSTKHSAEFLDERVWPYIKHSRDNPITAATISHHARQNGWQEPIDDLFKDLGPDDDAGAAAGGRFRVIPAHEFAERRPPDWIVRGVLPRGELAVVYGESGSGKSFFVLDLCTAITRGYAWRGIPMESAPVVYVAAEGAGGLTKRLKAYAHQFQVDLASIPFGVVHDAPNLMKLEDTSALISSIKAFGDPAVVVLDTWSQVMPGANENAGEDVGKALGHCKRISRVTGAMVLLIHHSGKDASKGARGWSGLNAASDCTIEITRNDHDRCATITKLKDGEDGAEFGFKLLTVPLGDDESSCVVEHGAVPEKRAKEPRGSIQKDIIKVIRENLGESNRAELIDVVSAAVDLQYLDPLIEPGSKQDRRRDVVNQAIQRMKKDGRLVVEGPLVGLPE